MIVADFIEVARMSELPDGTMKQVNLRGELIGLYRVGDTIYAMGDICTHEHAYLTDGEFEPEEMEVECPLHGSRFNIETGNVRILPATQPEPTYQVKVEGDVISVGSTNPRSV